MKTQIKIFFFILIMSLFSSCRKEHTEIIDNTKKPSLKANSSVADIMMKTTLNDGSIDNIIDYASCFSVKLPVVVTANGITLTINTEADYDLIENIFDESNLDTDVIELQYPITIIFSDYTEINVNSASELNSYIDDDCNDTIDDDIECIDFIYPITFPTYNTTTEVLDNIIISNDNEMYAFLSQLTDNLIVNIKFPIQVLLSDDSELIINNLGELESTIEDAKDICDEDDDNDYNDDDCIDCTVSKLKTYLIFCRSWRVKKFEDSNHNLIDNYIDYIFNFSITGSMVIAENGNFHYGVWSSSESDGTIILTIDLAGKPEFNGQWKLQELYEGSSGERTINLINNDLSFKIESECK